MRGRISRKEVSELQADWSLEFITNKRISARIRRKEETEMAS
jgi:hypothetical protein